MTSVRLHLTERLPKAHVEFIQAARKRVEAAVNDLQFLKRVGESDYESPRLDNGIPLTSSDVASILVAGREFETSDDNLIDLHVSLAELDGREAGQVLVSPSIVIDTHYFEKCLAQKATTPLAGLLLHEWMHAAGCPHAPQNEVMDVPTRLGSFLEDLSVTPGVTWGRTLDAALLDELSVNRAGSQWICTSPPLRRRRSRRPAPKHGNR